MIDDDELAFLYTKIGFLLQQLQTMRSVNYEQTIELRKAQEGWSRETAKADAERFEKGQAQQKVLHLEHELSAAQARNRDLWQELDALRKRHRKGKTTK